MNTQLHTRGLLLEFSSVFVNGFTIWRDGWRVVALVFESQALGAVMLILVYFMWDTD